MPGRRPAHALARVRLRLRSLSALLVLALIVAACSSANSSGPTWVPQPSFSGDGGGPASNEIPGEPADSDSPSTGASSPGASSGSSASSSQDPNVVATGLTTPDAVAVLPDLSALVGERTTGKILHVQPVAGRPTPVVKTIPGLSTAGGGGLLDLMLSPYYASDGLIFAYITTTTDNRVVEFTLAGAITPVLTGIPRGAADNDARLASDGRYVYVATGGAGRPATGTSLNSKVLRVTDIGRPAPGNPSASSPVYASGAGLPRGLCYSTATGLMFAVSGDGRVAVVTSAAVLSGSSAQVGALPTKDSAPGGCAVQGGTLYATSSDGQALLAATLTVGSAASASRVTLGSFTTVLSKKYGRLLTVTGASDGSLWMTTTNRDGKGRPIASDERVIHLIPPQGDEGSAF